MLHMGGALDRRLAQDMSQAATAGSRVEGRLVRTGIAHAYAIRSHVEHGRRDPAHHGGRPTALVGGTMEHLNHSFVEKPKRDRRLPAAHVA